MGKSDRAFVFSVLALCIAFTPALPGWANWGMWLIALLAAMTIINRVYRGLAELTASR
jgi:phosphatidylglycerophosphate synthase